MPDGTTLEPPEAGHPPFLLLSISPLFFFFFFFWGGGGGDKGGGTFLAMQSYSFEILKFEIHYIYYCKPPKLFIFLRAIIVVF